MKNGKLYKEVCAASLAAISLVVMTGCGGKKDVATTEGGNKLRCWMPLNYNAATVVSNYGDTELAKELSKRLGIEVEYVHPPQGQESEKFSILIASTSLPDIIEYNWMSYPGGPGKAIKEGVIRDIGKERDKAPNLFSYLGENKEINRLVTTDEGEVFSFPFIRGDKDLCVSAGLFLREDWLKDLGLSVPKTIDEWENVMTAFKEKKGVKSPLAISNPQFFAAAYNTTTEFYVDNKTVKYGYLDPQFKDYLKKMNEWYKKGLLDQSFATLDGSTREANILNGLAGAGYGSVGQGIGKLMNAAKDKQGFSLVGAPVPVLNSGERARFGMYQLPVTASPRGFDAISTECKNLDAAYKFLDYGYSEEGRMLYNFGIEGKSYEMKDGYPTYTDEITKNPEGLSMTVALSKYTRSFDNGPFVQDRRYMEQYAALPQQKQAWEVWSDNDASTTALPHLYMKPDEQTEFAQLLNDIQTYSEEMHAKFIIGSESIDNYDKFEQQLKARGIDKLLKMYQDAYDRYLKK